jgi:hypothetical protein
VVKTPWNHHFSWWTSARGASHFQAHEEVQAAGGGAVSKALAWGEWLWKYHMDIYDVYIYIHTDIIYIYVTYNIPLCILLYIYILPDLIIHNTYVHICIHINMQMDIHMYI